MRGGLVGEVLMLFSSIAGGERGGETGSSSSFTWSRKLYTPHRTGVIISALKLLPHTGVIISDIKLLPQTGVPTRSALNAAAESFINPKGNIDNFYINQNNMNTK